MRAPSRRRSPSRERARLPTVRLAGRDRRGRVPAMRCERCSVRQRPSRRRGDPVPGTGREDPRLRHPAAIDGRGAVDRRCRHASSCWRRPWSSSSSTRAGPATSGPRGAVEGFLLVPVGEADGTFCGFGTSRPRPRLGGPPWARCRQALVASAALHACGSASRRRAGGRIRLGASPSRPGRPPDRRRARTARHVVAHRRVCDLGSSAPDRRMPSPGDPDVVRGEPQRNTARSSRAVSRPCWPATGSPSYAADRARQRRACPAGRQRLSAPAHRSIPISCRFRPTADGAPDPRRSVRAPVRRPPLDRDLVRHRRSAPDEVLAWSPGRAEASSGVRRPVSRRLRLAVAVRDRGAPLAASPSCRRRHPTMCS